MSYVNIKDGTGGGYLSKVDINNRTHTQSVTQSRSDEHCDTADRYNLNTGNITLTSANESAVMYVKNNETKDLVIDAVIYIFATSTGGSGYIDGNVFFNPTGGTIVSNADAVEMNVNLQLGSAKTLDIDVYKGAEGYTLTGGTKAIGSLMKSPEKNIVAVGKFILPKGKSCGITVIPEASNTSMVCQFAMLCYLEQLNKESL